MPTPTSQGTICSFNGTELGRVTGFRASPGAGVFVEKTNVTSQVVGAGESARIVKSYDCVAVDPGTLEFTLYGCPPYSVYDIGAQGVVSVVFDGGALSKLAFLEDFEVTGSVGQFLVGRAVFKLSGDMW